MKIKKIDLNKSILKQLEEDYPEEAKDISGYRNLNSVLCLISLKINDIIDRIEKKEEKRNENKEELLDLLDRILQSRSSFEIANLSYDVHKVIERMKLAEEE